MALGMASVLAGCSKSESTIVEEQADTSVTEEESVAETAVEGEPDETTDVDEDELSNIAPFSSAKQLTGLSDVQRNSINMLNYLAVLMQEINESKNSRLLLENIYSGIIDNVSPDAVDGDTLDWINDILDELETYRMLTVKRERLQTIYERAQADALKQAIPNPLGLLSAVQSRNLIDLAASVVYMAVDSVTSYTSAMSAAETEYMQDGWELDDEESAAIHNSRKGMFNYTVNMVSEYNLPGSLALTEDAVTDFVDWQEAEVARRIRFFEKESDKYCAVGEYWLMLARSYKESGQVAKCVKAVETYEELSTGILRKDHSYAKTLSVALAAMEEAQDGRYAEYAERWIEEILKNCAEDDWALRYYAVLAYIALARESDDTKYLSLAYETALDNANELIDKQRSLNEAYLSPVQTVDGAANWPLSSEEEKEKYRYNQMLEAERKVELAPVHEPLVMNLEVLRTIQLDYPDAIEGASPEDIIHSGGSLFLIAGLDDRYATPDTVVQQDGSGIVYDHAEVRIPASLVSANAVLTAEFPTSGGSATITDWVLDRVERETDDDISTFVAVYTSETAKDADYEVDTTVTLTIDPMPQNELPQIVASYNVVNTKTKLLDNVAVWDDGLGFEQL